MGIFSQQPDTTATISTTPLGGLVPVFRSGTQYIETGTSIKRADYPALSESYPRTGRCDTTTSTMAEESNWSAIAFGNGVFVAVSGASGNVKSDKAGISKNGKRWCNITMPVVAAWSAIAFGNGVFVAVAAGLKLVATSSDGCTWVMRENALPDFLSWNAIAFCNNQFVCLASDSAIAATSTDAQIWVARNMPTNSGWCGVAYGNNRYVAVSTTANDAATSTDAQIWAARVNALDAAIGIAFGNGIFVAVSLTSGSVGTTVDGVNWAKRPYPRSGAKGMLGIAFGNGVFVALASNGVATSSDGANWDFSPLTNTGQSFIAYGAGMFAICPPNGRDANFCYVENTTNSEFLYLSGPVGMGVRVL